VTKARNFAGHASTDTRPAGNAALIAAELTATRCRWCNDELEHCHESLVVHAIGETECMGGACGTAPELHHLVIPCRDFGCACADAATARASRLGGGIA